jgi:hypothetical protein
MTVADLGSSSTATMTERTAKTEPALRRIVRKHQPWNPFAGRLDVSVDGLLLGPMAQGETLEGSVGAGPHTVAFRPSMHGTWQSSTLDLEAASNREIVVSLAAGRPLLEGAVTLVMALLLRHGGAAGSPEPEVRVEHGSNVDLGRPAPAFTAIAWLAVAIVTTLGVLVHPMLGLLIAFLGLLTILFTRMFAAAQRRRRPPALPANWIRRPAP